IPAEVDRTGDRLTLWDRDADGWITLDWLNPLAPPDAVAGAAGGLGAPMPGKVTAVLVEAGAKVEAGTPLLVLEAMKMEHVIKAPAAGTVTDLPFAVGDQVMEGAALVAFEAAS
ncbi:MAG TPA: 3-methylcrotonyl-CoA carboxylase, partial [Rhodospirillaceae bacterium]|nr:3-methylcrotonyl-CoA carboxylase [Rhodospirillaceae bacterium]